MLALRNKVKAENHLEMCGRSREGTRIKRYLYSPMDFAKR